MKPLLNAYSNLSCAIEDIELQRIMGSASDTLLEQIPILRTCRNIIGRIIINNIAPFNKNNALISFNYSPSETQSPASPSENDIAEFLIQLCSPNGVISLRTLIKAILDHAKETSGLSPAKIAQSAGLHKNTIYSYLNGYSSLSTDNLEKIINYIQTNS